MPFLEWACFTKTTAISTPMDAVSALTSIRAGFEAGPLEHPVHPTWGVQELRITGGLARIAHVIARRAKADGALPPVR